MVESQADTHLANLIEALRIVAKYVDPQKTYCHCEPDLLLLPLAIHATLDHDDETRLLSLGAHRSPEFDCWAVNL